MGADSYRRLRRLWTDGLQRSDQLKNLRIRYRSAEHKDDRFEPFVLADTCAPVKPGCASCWTEPLRLTVG